jgi:integrase/recombinase XerD
MTPLRKRMLEELQRRNYSSETIRAYLFAVKDFAAYFKKRPEQLGQEHLRQYQLHLLNDRKLTVETIVGRIAALRFFSSKCFGDPIARSILSIRNAPSDSR